jgi:hypothetical protein
LGNLYKTGITKFRQARRSFKYYSPLKFDLAAVRNLWGAISPLVMAPILYVLEGFGANRLLPPVVGDNLPQTALAPSLPYKP